MISTCWEFVRAYRSRALDPGTVASLYTASEVPRLEMPAHPKPFFLQLLLTSRGTMVALFTVKGLFYGCGLAEPWFMAWLIRELKEPSSRSAAFTAAYLGLRLTALLLQLLGDFMGPRSTHKFTIGIGTWAHHRMLCAPVGMVDQGSASAHCGQGQFMGQVGSSIPFLPAFALAIPRLGGLIVMQMALIGPAAWSVTVAILLAQYALQARMRVVIKRVSVRKNKASQERLKCIEQALDELKLIRYFGQENDRMTMLATARTAESAGERYIFILNACSMAIASTVAFTQPVLGLLLYAVFEGKKLSPDAAWAYWSINEECRNVIYLIFCVAPQFSKLSSGLHAYKEYARKLAKFGAAPPPSKSKMTELRLFASEYRYHLKSGKLSDPILHQPGCYATKGKLSVVVGPTGSGKTSLLLAFLGELDAGATSSDDSTVRRHGLQCAYCAQQCMLFNQTIRENIVFGRSFEPNAYKSALALSCLKRDLDQIDNADGAVVASGGGSLSGGQQMRVALARAFYALLTAPEDQRVLIADDPLAALDAKVALQVFRAMASIKATRCVAMGTLAFVRHPSVGDVTLLERGHVVAQGVLDRVVKTSNSGWLDEALHQTVTMDAEKETGVNAGSPDHSRRNSSLKRRRTAILSEALVTHTEVARHGGVDPATLRRVARMVGSGFAMTMVAYYISIGAIEMITSYLAAAWIDPSTNETENGEVSAEEEDLKGIVMESLPILATMVSLGVLICLYSVVFATKGQTIISKLLLLAFHRILHCPLPVLQMKSKGELTNRLSMVVTSMMMLLQASQGFLSSFIGLVFTLSYTVPVYPPTVVFVIFSVVFVFMVGRVALPTSRDLGRVRAMARTPLMAILTEHVKAVPTIRALRAEGEAMRRFIKAFRLLRTTIEANNFFSTALSLILGLYSWLYTSVVVAVLWLARESIIEAAGMSGFGFVLNGMRRLSYQIRDLMLGYIPIEEGLVAAQRVTEYIDRLEQEAPRVMAKDKTLGSWPTVGKIELCNLTLKYAVDAPPSLRHASFSVPGNSRVGIVGRSGAGKSTIIAAVLRLVEASGGMATLDGVDLSSIGLRILRSKVAVVPQEPILLAGTLRFNMDANNEQPDAKLWQMLAHFGLKSNISALPDQLNTSTSGLSLSVGESQMVCVSRAVLRDTRVLLLDEATSALDAQSERLVDECISTFSSKQTRLAIAHHLHTIIGYDRVLVMDKGEVVEFGAPRALVASGGVFAALVAAQGI